MSDNDFDKPDKMLARVVDFAGKLESYKNNNNLQKVSSYISIIESVLQKLRGEYQGGNLSEEQIDTLKQLSKESIEPAKTLIRNEITKRHDALYKQYKKSPSPGVRFSNNRRVTVCFKCHAGLDSWFDLECNACGWIVCWCGACGCIKNTEIK